MHNVVARLRAKTQNVQQGEQETRGWEKEGQNSGEQRHEEICGRERDGARNMGNTRWTLQGLSGPNTIGTFRKESREFEGGFGVD